jgi:GNAT superfamily N-acetyltransferase
MHSTDVTIREARPSDLHAIVAFNRAMALESEGKALDPGTLSEGVHQALTDPARSLYFVAELDGRVVGQTMLTTEWSDWRNGFFWWIQSVYVDPPYRRRGVFRALHAHVRAEAKKRSDVCGLRLYVHRSNSRALTAYENLGMDLTEYRLCEEDWSNE